MTIFNWHLWCKWEHITEYDEYEFEGNILKREVNTKYRRCKECGRYQKIFINLGGGTAWADLSEQETRIIFDKYVFQMHTREKPKFTPPKGIMSPTRPTPREYETRRIL